MQTDLDFSHAFAGFRTNRPIERSEGPGVAVSEAWYHRGFSIESGIPSPEEAAAFLRQWIAGIDPQRLPVYGRFAGRIRLASHTCIPTCMSIVDTTFQGLHFDMGIPIVSDSPQAVQLVLALYRPLDGDVSDAATRVVPLPEIARQRSWPGSAVLEDRVCAYARLHGDGWVAPKPVNTFRLACFARLMDAIDDTADMADRRDVPTGLEFCDPENEYAFFDRHGVDVAAVEERVMLKPGQLLIVDNLRAAHGRVGKRRVRELHHFLFGVPSATPADIAETRKTLLNSFV